jgi:catechol 2,3-dioxygenase-like lactoylglutathione lyase family enzyme
MLPLKSFSHVSVTVSDLEKARAFYGGLIGLKEIACPPFDFPGAWYEIGSVQVHIIVNEKLPPRPVERERFGFQDPHFAIWVEDADDIARRLAGAGVPLYDFSASPTGFRQLFIKDPDGNMVEFLGPTRTGA